METETLQQDEQQLVVFDLSSESYGVDTGAVREIIRLQDITKVPRTTYINGRSSGEKGVKQRPTRGAIPR